MKTLKKIMMAMFVMACVGLTVSCNKDNDNGNGGGGSTQDMLVGTWNVTSLLINGNDMTAMIPEMQIVMNANGSGNCIVNGRDNQFTWSYANNVLTVNTGNGETVNCTITSINSTTAIFTSSNMSFPGMGQIPGEVTITLTKAGGNPDPQPDIYSQLLPGTWQIDNFVFNGNDMTEMIGTIRFTFNANGTGVLSDNGETQNNDFTWVISGNTITITEHGHNMEFTITNMTATECSFNGTTMYMDGQSMTGNFEIHMVKVNGGGDDPNPDPVPGELTGTSWGYTYNGTITEQDMEFNYTISMLLVFTTSTTGTLEETMTITSMGQSDTETINFTYTYNVNSHSGTMTATTTDPDTGEPETQTLPFTYNPSTNTITVTNTSPDADEGILPRVIEFTRLR